MQGRPHSSRYWNINGPRSSPWLALSVAAVSALALTICLSTLSLHHKTRSLTTDAPTLSASPSQSALIARIAELETQLQLRRGHTLPPPPTHQASRDAPSTVPVREKQRAGWYRDVSGIPKDSTVWVTFVNGDEKYREMMLNWALHLRSLRVPHVVVAFDDAAAAMCGEHDIPFMRHDETLASGDFRGDFSEFRKMGANKPLIVRRLLEDHAFSAVVLSDVDTVWLRDPTPFFARHPSADVLISTDCLSHWLEAQHDTQSAQHTYYHRCGHLPGATFGRAFNTGVVVFRNRPATLAALRAWRQMLTDPGSAYAPSTRSHGVFAITDQLAFNMVLEQGISPIKSTPEDWRGILAMNGTLRLLPLPALLFTNGHVFFYQHLPALHQTEAFVVHCTFQRHHTSGKRARLREHGLWLADPPEYFQADALMTYGSDVREYIAALEAQASTPMAALFKHFQAMAYQLAQMRDAFAVARALKRTLVLPPLLCYCDQDWYASILTRCRMDGSDLALPFECPLDTVLNPGALDVSALPYRMQAFLSDARTPQRVKRSREPVVVDADEAWVAFQQSHNVGTGAFVAAGADATSLRSALHGTEAVHVLQFQGLRPGSFGGFGSATQDAAFDRDFATAVGDEARWCCSGEQPIEVDWITWRFQMPPPLTNGNPVAWRIPRYDAPPHCDRIRSGEAGPLNVAFLQHANHPCTFLARGTALPETLLQVLQPQRQLALPRPG